MFLFHNFHLLQVRSTRAKAEAKVSGEFNIPIRRVRADGESESNSDGELASTNPTPKVNRLPFVEKKSRAKREEAAEIARGRAPEALMQAATSKIGKIHKPTAYIMRKLRDPKEAEKIKKLYLRNKKNKGLFNFTLCSKIIKKVQQIPTYNCLKKLNILITPLVSMHFKIFQNK